MKHTKGPWFKHAGVEGNTSAIWGISNEREETCICVTKDVPGEELNANLIAAAPEMYDVLNNIFSKLEKHEDYCNLGQMSLSQSNRFENDKVLSCDCNYSKVRDILKKAKGEK